jgi:hypothetical protein
MLQNMRHAMEAGLIFCSIVRCRKVNSEDVAELVFVWRDEKHAYTCAIDVEGTIEVHRPVPDWPMIKRCTEVCPLDDKVDQCLRLDSRMALEL